MLSSLEPCAQAHSHAQSKMVCTMIYSKTVFTGTHTQELAWKVQEMHESHLLTFYRAPEAITLREGFVRPANTRLYYCPEHALCCLCFDCLCWFGSKKKIEILMMTFVCFSCLWCIDGKVLLASDVGESFTVLRHLGYNWKHKVRKYVSSHFLQ